MLQVNEEERGASQTGGLTIDRLPVGKSSEVACSCAFSLLAAVAALSSLTISLLKVR